MHSDCDGRFLTSGGPDLRQRQAAFRTISSFSVKTTAFFSALTEDSSLLDSLSDIMGVSRGDEISNGFVACNGRRRNHRSYAVIYSRNLHIRCARQHVWLSRQLRGCFFSFSIEQLFFLVAGLPEHSPLYCFSLLDSLHIKVRYHSSRCC